MILHTFLSFFSSKSCWKGLLTLIGCTNLVVSTFLAWALGWGWDLFDNNYCKIAWNCLGSMLRWCNSFPELVRDVICRWGAHQSMCDAWQVQHFMHFMVSKCVWYGRCNEIVICGIDEIHFGWDVLWQIHVTGENEFRCESMCWIVILSWQAQRSILMLRCIVTKPWQEQYFVTCDFFGMLLLQIALTSGFVGCLNVFVPLCFVFRVLLPCVFRGGVKVSPGHCLGC